MGCRGAGVNRWVVRAPSTGALQSRKLLHNTGLDDSCREGATVFRRETINKCPVSIPRRPSQLSLRLVSTMGESCKWKRSTMPGAISCRKLYVVVGRLCKSTCSTEIRLGEVSHGKNVINFTLAITVTCRVEDRQPVIHIEAVILNVLDRNYMRFCSLVWLFGASCRYLHRLTGEYIQSGAIHERLYDY